MEQHIASITKNAVDTIEVGFTEYKGAQYLDVRTYSSLEGREGKHPTKKGIILRPDLIPALIAAWLVRRGC